MIIKENYLNIDLSISSMQCEDFSVRAAGGGGPLEGLPVLVPRPLPLPLPLLPVRRLRLPRRVPSRMQVSSNLIQFM